MSLPHKQGHSMINRVLVAAAVAAGALSLGGCSTVIEGTSQEIVVNSNPQGAGCTLNRKESAKGPEVVIGRVDPTPGKVKIEKTKYDITVLCDKPGYQQGIAYDHSGVAGATVGNIILGGGIGWAIDSASGSDNKYDTPIMVTLVPVMPAAAAPAATPPTAPAPVDKPVAKPAN